jgi:MFS transporter, DHA1 family, tetracycline resistance protein
MRRLALPFVFAILVIDAVVASLLYPVFPRFTEGLRRPQLWYGVAMFLFSFAQFISAPALGALSDRRGRQPVFRLAAIGTFASMILLLPIRYVFFLGNRAMDGTTNGLYAVMKSAIVDLSPDEDVQRNVGLSTTISYVGLLLGPAVATGVLWFADREGWGEVRSLIIAGMVFAAINIVLSVSIPETKRTLEAGSTNTNSELALDPITGIHFHQTPNFATPISSWRVALNEILPSTMIRRLRKIQRLTPNLALLLTLEALFALCTGYYTYFGIFAAEGPLRLKSADISLLFLYFAIIGIISNTVFFARFASRINPIPTLKLMFGSGIFVMILYAGVGDRLWFLYVVLTIDMITVSLAPGLIEGLIGVETDEAVRGEVFGLAQGLQSFMGLASIGVYTVASLIDLRLPFLLFALPLVGALALTPRLRPVTKPRPTDTEALL